MNGLGIATSMRHCLGRASIEARFARTSDDGTFYRSLLTACRSGMEMRLSLAAVLLSLAFLSTAHAETLAELVKKEAGVDFGPCVLSPKPKLGGEAVHAVIPARFDKPGIWVTRTLLLVGVDAQKNVQGTLELKLADDVGPRESNVVCKKDRITIRTFGKSLSYGWTGMALRKR